MNTHFSQTAAAFVCLVGLSTTALADKASAAPLRVSDGLFQSDRQDLGLKTVRGRHSILFRATDDGYKFCHHANTIVFGDKLVVMWSNGMVDEDGPGQRILISYSSDGLVWSDPTVLVEPPPGKVYVAAGFLVSQKNLVAFFTATEGKNLEDPTALYATSSADGRVWSEQRRMTSGFFIATPQRLPSGRLLLAGEHVGARRKNQRMRLLYSDQTDGLGGWHEARIELHDPNVFGDTEPSPFLRRDGTIVMPFRNFSGKLLASVSTDQGRAWTPPVPTNFPDSTARFAAGSLPDGTIYLINNPLTRRDRRLLAIALSRDGINFDRAMIVRSEPTRRRYEGRHKADGWQYPHAVVWKGQLHVAYSINKEDVGVTSISLDDLLANWRSQP